MIVSLSGSLMKYFCISSLYSSPSTTDGLVIAMVDRSRVQYNLLVELVHETCLLKLY